MKLQDLTVLLADDQEDDVLLLKRAISKAVGDCRIQVVDNGDEAINYLKGKGQYGDRKNFPFPNVMILDLKMPRVGGLEVLEWLDQHPHCSVIPTVVFTSSAQPQDIKRAYELGTNAYFTKPLTFDDSVSVMAAIFNYWCLAHVPEPPPQNICQ